MKKVYKHFNIFFALVFFLSFVACGGANGESASSAISKAQNETRNSKYYNQIVLANSGEFAGLKIGDSRAEVKEQLPESAFSSESENYLYYAWEIAEHVYNLDLFFDENNQLSSIDGYVRFFDSKGSYDKEEAQAFYKDIKNDFTKKYGTEEEITLDDFTYIRWIFDLKDIEIGIDNAEVYWYIYAYKDNK